ncbi:hypothetical protein [Streptomyces sp. NPDC020298]|uniref:hypothetical protein n=1 Tax=unclassified Streptomyces TaxID=2593676 RepID=UPI0033CEA050
MALLEAAVSGVLETSGIAGAALLDGVTGFAYGSAGDASAAEDAHDLAHIAATGLNRAGFEGELESLIVTTSRSHHVVLRLEREGDPLLLCALADRDRTNIAWVLRELTARADRLLA